MAAEQDIDPSIPMGLVKTLPTAMDYSAMATQEQQRQIAAQNARQTQAQAAQTLQSGSVDLAEKQRTFDEGTRLRALFAQPGMTMQAALPQVMAINPNTGIALRKGMLDQQETQLKIQKGQLENTAEQNKQLGAILGTVHDAQTLQDGIASALGKGLITPQHAQTMLSEGWNDNTKAQVAQGVQMSMDTVQQHAQQLQDLEDKRKQVAADQVTAQQPAILAEGQNKAITSKPNANGLTAEQQTAADNAAATLAETKRRNTQTAANEAAQRANESKKTDIAQRTFEATFGVGGGGANGPDGKPLTGDAYLATLAPGRAAQIKAFANGALNESDLPRGNAKQPFLDSVMQYQPDFTQQAAQTRKDYGSGGKSGQNIQALNTATVHLDQLGEAAKAMANGSFTPGNKIINDMVTMFGGAAPTNFEGIKAAVASEMASALKGNATDQEIEAMNHTISTSSSPKALAGIVETNLHTLGAKLNTKDEQYHKAVPGDANYTPVLPTAQKVFDKHGVQPIQRLAVDPKVKAYADKYFGGDVRKAQAAIAQQGK